MKHLKQLAIISNTSPSPGFALIELEADGLGDVRPGQFVEVQAPGIPNLLRRPISVCDIDPSRGILTLLVRDAGQGTSAISRAAVGSTLSVVYPLGHGFSTDSAGDRPLLVGGGVGVAPLLWLGRCLKMQGAAPRFLLGARSAADLLLLERFKALGEVFITTDDGTAGHHGLVTTHPVMAGDSSMIYCCGPLPMMKAVAAAARNAAIPCEVSLENLMGCGLGACLCCVEPTVEGNLCVCTEGPVFNTERLLWNRN